MTAYGILRHGFTSKLTMRRSSSTGILSKSKFRILSLGGIVRVPRRQSADVGRRTPDAPGRPWRNFQYEHVRGSHPPVTMLRRSLIEQWQMAQIQHKPKIGVAHLHAPRYIDRIHRTSDETILAIMHLVKGLEHKPNAMGLAMSAQDFERMYKPVLGFIYILVTLPLNTASEWMFIRPPLQLQLSPLRWHCAALFRQRDSNRVCRLIG